MDINIGGGSLDLATYLKTLKMIAKIDASQYTHVGGTIEQVIAFLEGKPIPKSEDTPPSGVTVHSVTPGAPSEPEEDEDEDEPEEKPKSKPAKPTRIRRSKEENAAGLTMEEAIEYRQAAEDDDTLTPKAFKAALDGDEDLSDDDDDDDEDLSDDDDDEDLSDDDEDDDDDEDNDEEDEDEDLSEDFDEEDEEEDEEEKVELTKDEINAIVRPIYNDHKDGVKKLMRKFSKGSDKVGTVTGVLQAGNGQAFVDAAKKLTK